MYLLLLVVIDIAFLGSQVDRIEGYEGDYREYKAYYGIGKLISED